MLRDKFVVFPQNLLFSSYKFLILASFSQFVRIQLEAFGLSKSVFFFFSEQKKINVIYWIQCYNSHQQYIIVGDSMNIIYKHFEIMKNTFLNYNHEVQIQFKLELNSKIFFPNKPTHVLYVCQYKF